MTQKKKDLLISLFIVSTGLGVLILLWMISYFCGLHSYGFFRALYRLDSPHYQWIVEHGYTSETNTNLFYALDGVYHDGLKNGMGVYCFFPLYTLIVKAMYVLLGKMLTPYIVGSIVSYVLMVFFLYTLVRYLRLKGVNVNWLVISILFVFNPIMIYFYSFYTESLFMLLAILVLYFTDKKQYLLAGTVGALLTATRVNGLLFIFYLFFKIYLDNKENIKTEYHREKVPILKPIWMMFSKPKQLLSLAIFPLGLACFMLYLHLGLHLPVFAFSELQTAWDRSSNFIVVNIWKYFAHPTKRMLQSIFAILFFIFLFVMIKRKKYSESLILFCLSLLSLRTSVESFDRYVLGMLLMTLEIYYMYIGSKIVVTRKQRSKAIFVRVVMFSFIVLNLANIILVFFTKQSPLIY